MNIDFNKNMPLILIITGKADNLANYMTILTEFNVIPITQQ